MSALAATEKGPSSLSSVETQKLIVNQPPKLMELNDLLMSLENLGQRVSERTGEDRSDDLGGAGAGGAQQGSTGASARAQAIANLPPQEVILQKIEQHVQQEIRRLDRLARRAARLSGPGAAFRLNEFYKRIRRLNALLSELLEATLEVLKRLYIRIFVDRQPVL